MQKNEIYNWSILVVLSIIWGSSYILIKLGLLAFTPLQVALLRISISGIALLPLLLRHAKGTSIVVWCWCLVVGLIGCFIPFICFALAQTVINSSLAGMLNSLQPLFTLVVGILLFNQKLPRNQIFGVLIGLAGATILLGVNSSIASFTDNFLYSLLVVFATFCYGLTVNIIREYLAQVSPIKITTLSLGVLILPASMILYFSDLSERLVTEDQVMVSLIAIATLAIFGTTIAIFLYNKLIKDAGMMMASSVAYLIPVVAIIWGILDGEQIFSAHIFGISVIFIGLYIINQPKASASIARD
jgi:drug/metabolite transporter (DMT)-like permease